jgi:hypothetical protein
VKRAPVRVESQQSLRVREAVVAAIDGIARAKDAPSQRDLDRGVTEVTADELAEHVSETVERRLSRRISP